MSSSRFSTTIGASVNGLLLQLCADRTLCEEARERCYAEDRATFSDLRYIIEDQVAEGDNVVSRLTTRLTHDIREYEGFAPTGKEYEVTGIVVNRLTGDKIVHQI
jgi:predicted ester cyclase